MTTMLTILIKGNKREEIKIKMISRFRSTLFHFKQIDKIVRNVYLSPDQLTTILI